VDFENGMSGWVIGSITIVTTIILAVIGWIVRRPKSANENIISKNKNCEINIVGGDQTKGE